MWVIGIISILVCYLVYKLSQLILKNDELNDQDMEDVQDAESNEDADQDEEDSSVDTNQTQPVDTSRRFKSRTNKGV